MHRAGAGTPPDRFAGDADGQVVDAVAVEIADGQSRAETVVGARPPPRPPAPSCQICAQRRGQAVGTSEDDVHQAAGVGSVDALAGDADREVAEAVAVEVAAREGRCEPVTAAGDLAQRTRR